MGNNLKSIRQAKGWTEERGADELGWSVGQLRKLERGERRLKDEQMLRAAEVYGVPLGAILAEPETVPLVGFVGAGALASFYGEGQGPFEEVPSIDGSSSKTVAVEIRGGSLGPLFDRWICYYDDRHDPPTEALFGKLCVVGLSDGRVLVKQLVRGRSRGLFDLWSNSEPPIHDVPIEWAAPVTAIRPR